MDIPTSSQLNRAYHRRHFNREEVARQSFEEVVAIVKSEQQTWKEYFIEFGFSVVVTPKTTIHERFGEKVVGCNIEFSAINELRKFVNQSKSINKRYSFCEVEGKPKLFTVWLSPLLRA